MAWVVNDATVLFGCSHSRYCIHRMFGWLGWVGCMAVCPWSALLAPFHTRGNLNLHCAEDVPLGFLDPDGVLALDGEE